MQISVSVQLQEDDTFSLTAEEVGAKVLEALGGDTESDYCMAYVLPVPDSSQIGAMPGAAPPVE